MSAVFLDTGFLIALEAVDDQYHQRALTYWSEFPQHATPIVTTSYILDEVVTFFNARHHHSKAVEIGSYLLSSTSIQFIHVDEPLFLEGWKRFQRYHDKRYSLTDCISFTIMEQQQISKALAFDKHFVQAGFTII